MKMFDLVVQVLHEITGKPKEHIASTLETTPLPVDLRAETVRTELSDAAAKRMLSWLREAFENWFREGRYPAEGGDLKP